MDVRIEAAPMAAEAQLIAATVIAVVVATVNYVTSLVRRVASFSCPTLGSHSLSAVAPDYYFKEGLALAGA